MITLSRLQARVYFTIRQFGAMGPKQIGGRLDFEYEVASARVTKPLKELVEKGLLTRTQVNKRLVSYACAHTETPVFKVLGDIEEKELA